MLFKVMTNKITWQGHVATTLQLPSFLGASSVERMSHQRCLVFDLWNGWKNFLPTSRKVRKKNQIPRYHAPSPEGTMRKIRDRSMKNLLTQWDTEEENRKILSVFGEKPPNPDRKRGRKTEDWWGRSVEIWPDWFDKKSPNPNGKWGRKTKQST